MGARLLSTVTPGGVEYHHPDRLGTRLVTNPSTGGSFQQATLPFGTSLSTETTGTTNRRFTSYDRSVTSGLDYAVNRHYDPLQGRFTQVDPAGMKATHLEAPQTLNLYAYCANDPVNRTDPNGLGFFSFLKKLFRIVALVILVAALVLVSVGAGLIAAAATITGGSSWLATAIMWTAFIAAGIVAAVPIGEFFGHIAQWINRCRVPDFSGLSSRKTKRIAGERRNSRAVERLEEQAAAWLFQHHCRDCLAWLITCRLVGRLGGRWDSAGSNLLCCRTRCIESGLASKRFRQVHARHQSEKRARRLY